MGVPMTTYTLLIVLSCLSFAVTFFVARRNLVMRLVSAMGLSAGLSIICVFQHAQSGFWPWNVGFYLFAAASVWFFYRLVRRLFDR